MSFGHALAVALALIVGIGLGALHYSALHLVTRQFVEGRIGTAAGLQVGRLLLLGAVLVGAAWFGALPLLSCFAGLLIGRWIILRRVKEEA